MPDLNDPIWKILEVSGSWLSGIGTLMAVVVSLVLARRQTAVRLNVVVCIRLMVGMGGETNAEFLYIKVVNIGQQSVLVNNIGWKHGLLKRRFAIQLFGGHPYSASIPLELAATKEAAFFFPLNDHRQWLTNMSRELESFWPSLSEWRMRIRVHASVETSIEARLEQDLQQRLVAAHREALRK